METALIYDEPDEQSFEEPKSQEELQTELIGLFHYAEGDRQQWEEKAIKNYKLYKGYTKRKPNQIGSILHIPRTYEQIDTVRSKILKAFFGNKPYIDFLPKSNELDPELQKQNEAKARLAGALVDSQLEKNRIYSKFYDYVTNFLVFPAAIMSVGWRFEQKQVRKRVPAKVLEMQPVPNPIGMAYGMVMMPVAVEVPGAFDVVTELKTIWDDNEIQVVDFFDFWVDPRASSLEDARFVIQREFMSREDIENKLQKFGESTDGGVVFPMDWAALKDSGGGLTDGRYERMNATDITQETTDGSAYIDEKYEVLWFWYPDKMRMLINRKTVAYSGPNPYWHGKLPFVMTGFDPLPNEIYSLSAVDVIADLQDELNTHRNQRIDNVSLILNKMWMKRRTAEIPDSELVSRPHGIIEVESLDDLKAVEFEDVTTSAYQEEAIIKSDMENAIGTPPVVRGTSGNAKETATEIVTKNTNAGIRFETKILLYEALALIPMAELMDLNNQQFIEDERIVKMYGEEGLQEWQAVSPGDLFGEHDYRPSGSSTDPSANKEIRRQQLKELVEFVMKANLPFVKRYNLVKLLFENYDVKGVEQVLFTRDEMVQMGLNPDTGMPMMPPIDPATGQPLMPGPAPAQPI